MTGIEDLDQPQRVDFVLAIIRGLLAKLGVSEVTPESVIVAPPSRGGRALLSDGVSFDRFRLRFALKAGFVGYSFDDIAALTVKEVCEKYVAESYPAVPTVALSGDQYGFEPDRKFETHGMDAKDFPICFVLGCGRSGTTLLRVMLNVHEGLWAPGELHLANFEGMADRAINLSPLLRTLLVPEVASRLGEPIESFSETFASWESEDLSISTVYEKLQKANPDALIVDKTPTYSNNLQALERIGRQFPNARFVYLVRNPHDVIRSLVRTQLYKGAAKQVEPGLNPYQIGEVAWCAHNSNIERFLGGIPGERKLTVRYEDLVSDPTEPLTRICDLLDRTFDVGMVDPYKSQTGRVALGAGDMTVNFLKTVENRMPSGAFYPVGEKCRSIASRHGY